MREARSRSIGGMSFTVQQLPATRGTRLLHKIISAVGPAMLKAGMSSSGAKSIADLDLASLPDAARMLFDRLSADDLESVMRELFETATVTTDGKTMPLAPVYDNLLAGKQKTIFQLAKFAIEVNFEDFLGALVDGAQAMQTMLGSTSPTTSPQHGPASV